VLLESSAFILLLFPDVFLLLSPAGLLELLPLEESLLLLAHPLFLLPFVVRLKFKLLLLLLLLLLQQLLLLLLQQLLLLLLLLQLLLLLLLQLLLLQVLLLLMQLLLLLLLLRCLLLLRGSLDRNLLYDEGCVHWPIVGHPPAARWRHLRFLAIVGPDLVASDLRPEPPATKVRPIPVVPEVN